MYIGDIKEANGKTIKENNLRQSHKIPIGTLVEVRYDKWFGNGACEKVIARLFVISHDRDCDGTPLYSLCKTKDFSTEYRVIFTTNNKEFEINDKSVCRNMIYEVESGFAERDLKIIEITPEIISGKDALEWDKK